jgi:hypothetical protein
MAEEEAGIGNALQYQKIKPERVAEYIAPGSETADAWQAFAERVGWGDDPGGLFLMILHEQARFWLTAV